MNIKLYVRLTVSWLLLTGVVSEAAADSAFLTGSQSLTISIPSEYSSVSAHHQSQVQVVAGGSVAIYDGFDTTNLVLDDGHISWVTLRNQASATFNQNADASYLNAYDTSRADINGATITHVHARNGSELVVRDGTISYLYSVPGKVRIEHISFDGGFFTAAGVSVFGGALIYGPFGDVDIVGTFDHMDNGRLYGRWANGEPFSFWTIRSSLDDTFGTGATYSLPASLPNQIRFVTTPVPEPETYALMLMGIVMVGIDTRRRRCT